MRSASRFYARFIRFGVVSILTVTMVACGGGGGDGGQPRPVVPPQNPGGGGGGGGGTGFGVLNTPVQVNINSGGNGFPITYDASAFNVRRSVNAVASVTLGLDQYDPFIDARSTQGRNTVYGLNIGSGNVTALTDSLGNGVLNFPIALMVDDARLFALTFRSDLSAMFLTQVAPDSGAVLGQSEVAGAAETCFAVAGDDYFFNQLGELKVARDFATAGFTGQPEVLGSDDACGTRFAAVDGALVALDYPTVRDPAIDSISAWDVDPITGVREAVPLASVPLTQVAAGGAGDRFPDVAAASDRLYMLTGDAVSIELHAIDYAQVPGSGSGGGAGAPTPELLGRIEMPFFANVIPGNGTLSVERIDGFGVDGGVVAVALRLREEAGGSTFFWQVMVVGDLNAGAVDLLQYGMRLFDFVLIE